METEILDLEINDFLFRFIDYADEIRKIDVTYAKRSWQFEKYEKSPYRRAFSSYWGQGNRRWLKVLASICYSVFYIEVFTTPVYSTE